MTDVLNILDPYKHKFIKIRSDEKHCNIKSIRSYSDRGCNKKLYSQQHLNHINFDTLGFKFNYTSYNNGLKLILNMFLDVQKKLSRPNSLTMEYYRKK